MNIVLVYHTVVIISIYFTVVWVCGCVVWVEEKGDTSYDIQFVYLHSSSKFYNNFYFFIFFVPLKEEVVEKNILIHQQQKGTEGERIE